MSTKYSLETHKKEELIDITSIMRQYCKENNLSEGHLLVFIPHTTAAITINENADPDVVNDILKGLKEIVPEQGFKHMEGNSPAHIKSSLIGPSLIVEVSNGDLVLGTWQGIYFCEFDGPRQRRILISKM